MTIQSSPRFRAIVCFFFVMTMGVEMSQNDVSSEPKTLALTYRPSASAGLIAHFPFDEDFKDCSGNKNHVRSTNGAKLDKGVIGSAASFDGKDDFIRVLPKSDVSSICDFSLSVWTFLKAWKEGKRAGPRFRDAPYIFDGHTASHMCRETGFHGSGFFAVYGLMREGEEIHNGVHLEPERDWYWEQKIPTQLKGKWRHMVFMREGDEDITYVDGKQQKDAHAFANKHGRKLNMQHAWFIGTFAGNDHDHQGIRNGINYSFHGLLDDLRIYDRALTAKEVMVLFRLKEEKLHLE